MNPFRPYDSRKIRFLGAKPAQGWTVKWYTISVFETFRSSLVLERIARQLPTWVQDASDTSLPTHDVAFLIIHEASDGYWVLFNWWTGGEMIRTCSCYLPDERAPLQASPFGSMICIWELEVVIHERRSWIQHILNNTPDFNAYLNDAIP